MKQIIVEIDGKKYPCRQTMGAMLRFKQETGKDVSEIKAECFSDVCAYFYCCVASACKHDGVEFGYSLMDFADSLEPKDLENWEAVESEITGADDKKESKKN